MASRRLAGKVGIVTGASSGLGRSIALHYAREGAKVICSDLGPQARSQVPSERNETTVDLIKNMGGEAAFVKADVGVAKEMENLVKESADHFGRVDIMVNNAGISFECKVAAPIHEVDEHVWDETMRVNSKSVFLGCKYAVQQMLKQPALPSGDRGWIINLSSIYGLVGGFGIASYAASKGAVTNLTRAVALDVARHKIRCSAINPGYTKTAIYVETTKNVADSGNLDERHPLNGAGKPEDIAKVAVVLASDDANWLTGQAIAVDGGYTAM